MTSWSGPNGGLQPGGGGGGGGGGEQPAVVSDALDVVARPFRILSCPVHPESEILCAVDTPSKKSAF